MSFFKKLFGSNDSSKQENRLELRAYNQDNQIEVEDIYKKSVSIFIDNYMAPDTIYDKLYQLTKSENDATLINLFIPYYFCRLVVPEVEYTDYYVVENADKSRTDIKFSESKVLSELFKSIRDNWNDYLKMDFKKILFHSGDFRAINDALKKGGKIENLQALPPTIRINVK